MPARKNAGQVHEDELHVISRPANSLRDITAEIRRTSFPLWSVDGVVAVVASRAIRRRQLEIFSRRHPSLNDLLARRDLLSRQPREPALDGTLDVINRRRLMFDVTAGSSHGGAADDEIVAVGGLKISPYGPHGVSHL